MHIRLLTINLTLAALLQVGAAQIDLAHDLELIQEIQDKGDPAREPELIALLTTALDAPEYDRVESLVVSAALHALVDLNGTSDGSFLLQQKRLARANKLDMVKVAAFAAALPENRHALLVRLLRVCEWPEIEFSIHRTRTVVGFSPYLFDYLLALTWTHARESFIEEALTQPMSYHLTVRDAPRLREGFGLGGGGAFGGGRGRRNNRLGPARVRIGETGHQFWRYEVELTCPVGDLQNTDISGLVVTPKGLSTASFRIVRHEQSGYLKPDHGVRRFGYKETRENWNADPRQHLAHALTAFKITGGYDSLKLLEGHESETVIWNVPHPVESLPVHKAQAQINLWRSLRDAMVTREFLSKERAAAIKPDHEIKVIDQRRPGGAPLPPLRPIR